MVLIFFSLLKNKISFLVRLFWLNPLSSGLFFCFSFAIFPNLFLFLKDYLKNPHVSVFTMLLLCIYSIFLFLDFPISLSNSVFFFCILLSTLKFYFNYFSFSHFLLSFLFSITFVYSLVWNSFSTFIVLFVSFLTSDIWFLFHWFLSICSFYFQFRFRLLFYVLTLRFSLA